MSAKKSEKSKAMSLMEELSRACLTLEEIQQRRLNEMTEYEEGWKKHSETREREAELHEMELYHAWFCGLIGPREVVELKELHRRFNAQHRLPSRHFLQTLVTAIADSVLLVKNKLRVLNNRRERVTMITVNPTSFRTFQAKLAELTQIKQTALTNSKPAALKDT